MPTPAFFWLIAGSLPIGPTQLIRATNGAGLPAATRAWTKNGRHAVELIVIDLQLRNEQPARSGLALAWIRYPRGHPSGVVLAGRSKGGWDCQANRMSMLVGGERAYPSQAAARASVLRSCGRRPTQLLRAYGQRARLCLPRR